MDQSILTPREYLPIRNMALRHTGLSPAVAAAYFEAACVCLDRYQAPPTTFLLQEPANDHKILVEWDISGERIRAAWANDTDATEAGAYACSLAAVELSMGMVAVRRAETKTGADYYIAPAGMQIDDLENCYRLEVAGTNKNATATIRILREKVMQARRGYSNLPAFAAVVGFYSQLIVIQQVPEDIP